MEINTGALEVMPLATSSAGKSSFACPACSVHLDKAEERTLLRNFCWNTKKRPCKNCSEEFTFFEYSVVVESSSAPLLDASITQTVDWYHATNVEDWLYMVTVENGMDEGEIPYVHLGTYEAAMDRARNEYLTNGTAEAFIVKVRLTQDAIVSPSFLDDKDQWAYMVDGKTQALIGDAARYVNRWEHPGSISLLVDPTKLVEISTEAIRG